jgi:hypothetical protein
MARPPARCGTPSGFRKHQDAGEKPCDACTAAKADYDRRWRSAPLRIQKHRLNARAQAEARNELARRYPAQYRKLYRLAKERLYDENGLTVDDHP